MLTNLSHLKLGSLPFTPSPKDLHFKAYLPPRLDELIDAAMAPGAINWHKVPTVLGDMPTPNRDPLHNDYRGNCVLAAEANGAMQVSQMVGAPRVITGDEVDAAYADLVPGFNPVTGEGDIGAYPRDALTAWTRKDIFGTRCLAHCLVDPTKPQEVLLALFLGGWLLGAYGLPKSAQGQVDENGNPDWHINPELPDADNARGSWGNHAMCEHADRLPQFTTWGMNAHATTGWRVRYVLELHMAILRDWRLPNGRAPNGFEFGQLVSDARARGAVVE